MFVDAPVFFLSMKIAQQMSRGEALLHLEMGVDPLAGGFDRRAGNIRAEDFEAPASQFAGRFVEHHRQRIGFLSGRNSGAPDAQASLAPARRHQLRKNAGAKRLERRAIAKERGFTCRHGVDRLLDKRFVSVSLDEQGQLEEIGDVMGSHHGSKPAFDDAPLVGADVGAGQRRPLAPKAREDVARARVIDAGYGSCFARAPRDCVTHHQQRLARSKQRVDHRRAPRRRSA